VFVAVLITAAELLVARAVIVPLIVTPAAAVGVQAPAPRFRMFIRVPMTYATDELAGIVTVLALAFDIVIVLPASVRTVVIEPVCVLLPRPM
jgi:hypothetical protein